MRLPNLKLNSKDRTEQGRVMQVAAAGLRVT